MVTPPYSTRFIDATLATSGTASYVVPAGFVAVVHQFSVVPLTDTGAFVTLFGPTGTSWSVVGATIGTHSVSEDTRGRYVYGQGETITVTEVGLGPAGVYVGGYLLSA